MLRAMGVEIMRSVLLMLGVAVLLAACSSPQEEAPEPYEDRETVFDPMTDTIDRAEAVEDIGRDRKRSMDEALEAAEGRAPE